MALAALIALRPLAVPVGQEHAPERLVAGVEKEAEVFGTIAFPSYTQRATHYGSRFEGGQLGCERRGVVYRGSDPTIVAVSPQRNAEWPCGTLLRVTGPAGSIVVRRQDTCGGCGLTMIDLSEAGSIAVCGGRPHTCSVTVQRVGP